MHMLALPVVTVLSDAEGLSVGPSGRGEFRFLHFVLDVAVQWLTSSSSALHLQNHSQKYAFLEKVLSQRLKTGVLK